VKRRSYDAVVCGSGPNGLAAAVTLARAGLSVLVVEGHDTPGGGTRTLELTLPGFRHDVCSTVHPLGIASPFFAALAADLARHGLSFVHADVPAAHVLDDGHAVLLQRSVEATAEGLGADAAAYREFVATFVERYAELLPMILGPLRAPASPLLLGRFGLSALRSARSAVSRFREPFAPALVAGMAAHAMLPLEAAGTASFALVLMLTGHAVGWPLVRGGSQSITTALVALLEERGGELELGHMVSSLSELPPARAYLLDVSPRALVSLVGAELPAAYKARLRRFSYGPGVFKMDWALSQPIPWRDPNCARASTVHLGGTFEQVATAERMVHAGELANHPFVLLTQPTLVDPQRAPPDRHIAWAYCHVPHASSANAARSIEHQIERAAPGFRDIVLARASKSAVEVESYNPNYVGGDINSGLARLSQLFFRPVVAADPYATGADNVFLCSSSTPPGGGVHGMCGYWAARSALRRRFGIVRDPLATFA
jgi:phytoene dehydrogenase-like protein